MKDKNNRSMWLPPYLGGPRANPFGGAPKDFISRYSSTPPLLQDYSVVDRGGNFHNPKTGKFVGKPNVESEGRQIIREPRHQGRVTTKKGKGTFLSNNAKGRVNRTLTSVKGSAKAGNNNLLRSMQQGSLLGPMGYNAVMGGALDATMNQMNKITSEPYSPIRPDDPAIRGLELMTGLMTLNPERISRGIKGTNDPGVGYTRDEKGNTQVYRGDPSSIVMSPYYRSKNGRSGIYMTPKQVKEHAYYEPNEDAWFVKPFNKPDNSNSIVKALGGYNMVNAMYNKGRHMRLSPKSAKKFGLEKYDGSEVFDSGSELDEVVVTAPKRKKNNSRKVNIPPPNKKPPLQIVAPPPLPDLAIQPKINLFSSPPLSYDPVDFAYIKNNHYPIDSYDLEEIENYQYPRAKGSFEYYFGD